MYKRQIEYSACLSEPTPQELLVLCNLRAREITKPLPVGWTDAEKLLGNYPDTADTLRPYECVVLKK